MTTDSVKASATRCPDHDVLHRLLLDRLDEEERREVQAHLDRCEACHEQVLLLVQSSPRESPDDGVDAPEAPTRPEALIIPTELGPPSLQLRPVALKEGTDVGDDFVVERPLARGGMGSVYEARQVSTGRACALKVMHARFAVEPELQARFLREARLASSIESDHVVEVIAVGVDGPGDAPWLAMELLPGADLKAYVAEHGPLPAHRVEAFVGQIGEALSAAHAEGIVHRDLKPQNLFVVERGGAEPLIKLLDFGIAKVLVDGTYDTTGAMGSPAWMAPEQCSPGRSIRPATDVWALGLLTFFMYAGLPFWRAMNDRGGVGTLMREMLFEPLPHGSDRARALGSGFPAGLDRWLETCLAREPEERYADAAVALAAYRRALDAEVDARPVAASRRYAGVALATLLMMMLGGGVAMLLRACS